MKSKPKKAYIDSKTNKIFPDASLSSSKTAISPDISSPVSTLISSFGKNIENEINYLISEKVKHLEKEIRLVQEKKYSLQLPISIFRNRLSSLEIVVKYLHENEKRSFTEIAGLLNRDYRTIWSAYQRAVRKHLHLDVSDSSISIPVSLFSERKYAPLEVVVSYLKEAKQLNFTEIASLLQRSPKTIWTVYQRKKEKDKIA